MSRDLPPSTAEGTLLRRARERTRPKTAITTAAKRAGVSSENWGHVERGYQSMGKDNPHRIVIPPAPTLAHMAHAVDVSPEELEGIGRADAADILRDLRPQPAAAQPLLAASDYGASAVLTTAREAMAAVRAYAKAGGKRVGEVLVEEGLVDPAELVIPDSLQPDQTIEEINASNIPEETKANLIRLHLENRARRFEEERLKRKKLDG